MNLATVKSQTEKIFENTIEYVAPSPVWQRKLEAFKENNLWRHYQRAFFDMRCEQAENLGLVRLELPKMVEMLMGSPHSTEIQLGGNRYSDQDERQNFEWFYNHYEDVETTQNCRWGGYPTDYARIETRKVGRFFKKEVSEEVWRCRLGKLNYLVNPIPYGVTLRMLEIKKLKLFNVFNVLAPIEAWRSKTNIDPIVVAGIFEVTSSNNKDAEYNTSGQTAYFFVAQW